MSFSDWLSKSRNTNNSDRTWKRNNSIIPLLQLFNTNISSWSQLVLSLVYLQIASLPTHSYLCKALESKICKLLAYVVCTAWLQSSLMKHAVLFDFSAINYIPTKYTNAFWMKKATLVTKIPEAYFLFSCHNISIWKNSLSQWDSSSRYLVDKNMVFHWHFDLKCLWHHVTKLSKLAELCWVCKHHAFAPLPRKEICDFYPFICELV